MDRRNFLPFAQSPITVHRDFCFVPQDAASPSSKASSSPRPQSQAAARSSKHESHSGASHSDAACCGANATHNRS